ncbi:hypothetical protein AB1L12_08675 [Peribacillus frigoritolerans]
MKAYEILEKFKLLESSKTLDEYNMVHIEQNIYIGKSFHNKLSVLTKYSPESILPTGRKTKGLLLQYYNAGEFQIDGSPTEANWAITICLDSDKDLLFATLVEGIINRTQLYQMLLPRDLSEYIAEWQELLSSAKELSLNESIGL